MCEACGPISGVRESIRPELRERMRTITRREAQSRGLTEDEYLDANHVPKPHATVHDWFQGVVLNLRLLKSGL